MRGLIIDSRQKPGHHNAKHRHFEESGETTVVCALPVGDYQRAAACAVDTKKDIIELASDIKQQHARFRRECERAQALGTQLVILVENEDGVRSLHDLAAWTEPDKSWERRMKRGAKMRYDGEQLAKACRTMHERYGVLFGFCSPDESGARVLELLERFGG